MLHIVKYKSKVIRTMWNIQGLTIFTPFFCSIQSTLFHQAIDHQSETMVPYDTVLYVHSHKHLFGCLLSPVYNLPSAVQLCIWCIPITIKRSRLYEHSFSFTFLNVCSKHICSYFIISNAYVHGSCSNVHRFCWLFNTHNAHTHTRHISNCNRFLVVHSLFFSSFFSAICRRIYYYLLFLCDDKLRYGKKPS